MTTTETLRDLGMRVRALPSDIGQQAVRDGEAKAGLDPAGGEALRCCLRDSRPGESLVLISAAPDGPRGVYAERGPVFVHAADCGGPADDGEYPAAWRGRTQVFRAYGHDGTIRGGAVVAAGTEQETAARELFDDAGVAFVQTRNVVYGCYMTTLLRA